MTQSHDVIVLGAGPAGYVAAIRAAQLGLKTVCVDAWLDTRGESSPGGTCLNVGCIPSKALLESSALYSQAAHGLAAHGIQCGQTSFDLSKMLARKDQIVRDLTQGIKALFVSNQVEYLSGIGRLLPQNKVSVSTPEGKEIALLKGGSVILATGSRPIELKAAPWVPDRVVDSSGALNLRQVPKVLGIIGAGVIGLELGSVWQRLGSKVVLFEALPDFLPLVDEQIAHDALKEYKRQGLEIRFNARVTACQATNTGVELRIQDPSGERIEMVDTLIVAAGRRPNSEQLAADSVALELDERGFVKVDEQCRTRLPNVFAIGDLVRGPMLAHKGSEEGMMVAELIVGNFAEVRYDHIPAVIYTHPEIAWVGATEQSLRASTRAYNKGVFPFAASGRARANGDTAGFVKVLADAKTDRVLGVHFFGAHASELVMQAVIALTFSASAEDLALTVFAHPTLSEAFHEAALAVDQRAIHIAKARRAST